MSKSAKARIDELTARIQRYNDAYYRKDAPLVTDAEWDALFRELFPDVPKSKHKKPK